MSSTYRAICLAHNPAIVDNADWTNWPPLSAAIADPHSGIRRHHPTCRLLIGRWSGALVEVICPAGHTPCHPTSDETVDASWLRLLALSDPTAYQAAQIHPCWTRVMARRLRYELGLPNLDGEACPAPTS